MTSEEMPLDAAIRGLARGRALDEVIDVGRPAVWLALDERIRSVYGWRGPERPTHTWLAKSVRPTVLRELLGDPAPTEAELVLALCDGDGRIREAALPHAARRPAVLPLIAVRTTDWVPAVRDRAREVLAATLPGADERTLAVTAPVILRLRDRVRGGRATDLLQELLRAAPDASLTRLFRNRDRPTRRIAFGLAVERGLLSPTDLARIAAYDEDVALRGRAANAALAAGVPDETLPLLLGARSGAVRSAGVTALRKAGRAAEAEPYLFDRSGLVRACARWVLRKDGHDALARYRAACADPATVPGWAPLGLAECGEQKADMETLWDLTGHPDPLVRSSSVAGLRMLEVADFARLLPLLDDPAPGVVRETARTLLPWADRVREEEFLRRTGPGRPVHVRVRALLLLREHASAVYREAAERLVADPDPVLRLHVRRALGREEPVPRPLGTLPRWRA
ncbi:hypothetical protein [Streptomyces fradiae]|uniref:hypothetical protein n=1 Tax=Streptomyces fradiae TaxID=1906 RepID=UPI0035122772